MFNDARNLRRAAHDWRQGHPGGDMEQAARDLAVRTGQLVAAHAGIHPGEPGDWRVIRLQPMSPPAWADWLACGAGILTWHAGDTRWQQNPGQPWIYDAASGSCADPSGQIRFTPGHARDLQVFACRQRFCAASSWRLMASDEQGQLLWSWALAERADLDRFGGFLARRASPSLDAGLWRDRAEHRTCRCDPATATAVREDWLSTRSLQEAVVLQDRWGLGRLDLLGLMRGPLATELDPDVLVSVLENARLHGLTLNLELLARSGRVRCTGELGPAPIGLGRQQTSIAGGTWLWNPASVSQAWWARHPTRTGTHEVLEFFDAQGQQMLRLSVAATASKAGLCLWHALLSQAADQDTWCLA